MQWFIDLITSFLSHNSLCSESRKCMQTIASSQWDRHSQVKHDVYVFKILPILAVKTPLFLLEIIIISDLHTFSNSGGCCRLTSCAAHRQTAAVPGCNEHLKTGGKSSEILNIMLLKPRNRFFSVRTSGWTGMLEQQRCTQGIQGSRKMATGKEFHMLKPAWNRMRPLAPLSLFIPPNL